MNYKCDYCGTVYEKFTVHCEKCGAPNPSQVKRDFDNPYLDDPYFVSSTNPFLWRTDYTAYVLDTQTEKREQ